jgi:hypothetical protein
MWNAFLGGTIASTFALVVLNLHRQAVCELLTHITPSGDQRRSGPSTSSTAYFPLKSHAPRHFNVLRREVHPNAHTLCQFGAANVMPLPRKGSLTSSPRCVRSKIGRRVNSTGFRFACTARAE